MASNGGPIDINFNNVGTSNISLGLDRSSNFYLVQTDAQAWSFKVWGAAGTVPLKELEIQEGQLSVTFSEDGNYNIRVGVMGGAQAKFTSTITAGAITVMSPTTGNSDKITPGDRDASADLPVITKS